MPTSWGATSQPPPLFLHPQTEWYFRSSLDRYIWVYGMACAMLHPFAAKALTSIDEMPRPRRWTLRAALVAGTVAVFAVYYKSVYVLPKLEYNKLHPYTSWIPLTCWMVVRNLTPQVGALGREGGKGARRRFWRG